MTKINATETRGGIGTGEILSAGRKLFIPTDTLFDNQWHLLNTGQSGGVAGVDLNITSVWDDYKGAGINVAVIDDGFDHRHSDLAPNYNTLGDRDFGQNDDDAAPVHADDDHGTATMGIIGADDNGTGTVGVAPDATLLGYRVDFQAVTALYYSQLADAIVRAQLFADVVNMSLGISDYSAFSNIINNALDSGSILGRGGLGTNYVVAGGNARGGTPAQSLDVGVDSLSAARETITVAAINDDGNISSYSSPGAPLLVSAFGSTGEIWTTDRVGSVGYDPSDHTSTFSGTSAAAPMVAGVVALMLDANANLGWRDVQDILAYSAVHTGTAIGSGHTGPEFYDWGWNGASNWNGGGLHFNNDYGFGLVDALAAVRLAETWTTQQTSANEVVAAGNNPDNFIIPDNSPTGVTFTVVVNGNVEIDTIELDISIIHTFVADLVVTLTSPDGTVSTILDETAPGSVASNSSWVFTSNAFRGEESQGTWTIFVEDRFVNDTGVVTDTTVIAHGSALPTDDLYVYTNEFSDFQGVSGHGTALNDVDGGDDTLNAAAVTAGTFVDLLAGTTSIDGVAGTISGVEHVFSGDGNDTLNGDGATNLLSGGRGNDTLDGGAGGDTLDGGAGTDIASYASAAGLVVAYRDAPTLNFGDAAGDSYFSIEGLEGSAHNDFLFGSNVTGDILRGLAGIDQIFGFGGNDTIDGGADFDYIIAGEGDDSIDGGGGLDILSGDGGNDTINGGDQFDQIFGGAGNDSLNGDGDSDYLFGGADNDTLNGGAGTDFLFGEAGADDLRGDGAYDLLQGGDGNDTLFGGDDGALIVNGLIGQGGDDRLIAGTGIDYMTGGDGVTDTGNDTFVFTSGGAIDVVLDFQAGLGAGDVIEIDSAATGISSFAQLQSEARLFDIGSYAGIIITAGADVVYLQNVTAASLVADDFAFV